MSSETSTEGQPAFEPWQLFTLAGLIGATIAVFMARGESPAAVILISLTIFAAAAVGIAALRTVLPLTLKTLSEGPRVLGGRTRAALEREKALVLRSIKELEFDRAMGKVSEKDFAEMSARLRARAAGLIRQLDAGAGYREQIEREIASRIRPAGPTGTRAATEPPIQPAPSPGPSAPAALDEAPSVVYCTACGVSNEIDARFCKRCGKRIVL